VYLDLGDVMAYSPDLDIPRGPEVSMGAPAGLYRRFFKRGLDLAVALLLLPIVLPAVLLLGLLIRGDGGPAFYSQARVGRGGRVFRCWKLRTMQVDADRRLAELIAADPAAHAEWTSRQKLRNDPRITPLGRLLRRTSLDELPQLWNVLKGDMSLVGPRPMLPDQARLYPGWAYYTLRPGLTGFWQVSERNETSFAERAVYDTDYSRRLSFGTDILVLLATAWVVVRGTGY
jgi:lipopolysaccharide/colanic/teichoic acid biosynthesis glycosyltransferase